MIAVKLDFDSKHKDFIFFLRGARHGVIPKPLLCLRGPPPEARALVESRSLLERAQQPGVRVALVAVLLAQGAAQAALSQAQALRSDPRVGALAAWFQARIFASQGKPARETLGLLREAQQGGLSGPLKTDLLLRPFADEKAFRALFPTLPLELNDRWPERN